MLLAYYHNGIPCIIRLMTALQKNTFAHCTMHFNMLFPCSSAIIPVTVWLFTPTLSGTVRHFMTCLNFFWNHILASKQQMCVNHVLMKTEKEVLNCTVLLSIWQSSIMCKCLAHIDSSMTYWTDYCPNYVHWLQTGTNSTSNVCENEHVNVIEKFWLYKLSKNIEVQREWVDWTFTRCCLCVTFLQQRNDVLFLW